MQRGLDLIDLGLFLEKHVERQYRANVARVVPLLRQERQATEAALKAADEELAALTPERLRRSAEAVADKFCRSLGAAVAGSVAAETNIYGERLADERVSGGAFLAPVETLVEEDEDVEEDNTELKELARERAEREYAEFRARQLKEEMEERKFIAFRNVGHSSSSSCKHVAT